jgi:S-formylglutathione hydrolase FrmB
MKITLMCCALCCVVLVPGTARAKGSIEIENFSLNPMQLERDGSFELSLTAKAVDVPKVSYVLRTVVPAPKAEAPPQFDRYAPGRQLAYVQENGQVNLSDNGVHDLNPKDHAFRMKVDTQDWPIGVYELVVFAHNRPGGGAHIKDSRRFAVVVEENETRVVDRNGPFETRFTRCEVVPAVVEVGGKATLHVGVLTEGVEIRRPYYARPEHAPKPFVYSEDRISYLAEVGNKLIRDNGAIDGNQEEGALDILLDTAGWQPGLYYLEVTAPSTVGKPEKRYTVLTVRAPDDQFEVRVTPSWPMAPGTHADRMTRAADGALLHTDRYSTDGGTTWKKRETGTMGIGSVQLRDGRVLGMGYRMLPIEGREGLYRGERYESTDNGRTVTEPVETLFLVPQAKAAHGHAYHPGPLFMRSIVERADGSLIALMAGWFKGDDTPCPYSPKRPYSRTYTCESADGGKTWTYLSTIGYDHIGSEGYNEGSMKRLPDGRLMAVLRTGSMSSAICQDNPIMVSVSEDDGATWSQPRRTGAHGAFPELIVLSDGNLALSYGRPGANIAFSTDKGLTWHDHTSVDSTPYSGYTSMAETAPGEIVMVFGTKERPDPETGQRSSDLRVAKIQYREQGDVKHLAPLEQQGVSAVALGDGFYDCSIYSKALGRSERFALHLPADYDPERAQAFPLITFLHGAGRNHLSLIENPRARDVLSQSPAVFLSPNGRLSWWVNSPVDSASQYASFLDECIDLVSKNLHVAQEAKHRAIGGWSMGGFGSANYAESHPNDFGSWGGIVALLDFPNAQYAKKDNHSVPSVLGDASQQARFNPLRGAAGLRGKRILFITAEKAFDRLMNETFAARLTELGIPHAFTMIDGAHTLDVVLESFPRIMDFFHDTFAK